MTLKDLSEKAKGEQTFVVIVGWTKCNFQKNELHKAYGYNNQIIEYWCKDDKIFVEVKK